MSMRFRFAELNNTFDLALAGPFFYEKGGGYDWAWSEAYFNGVRWKGKKIPELPLLQPEKVSDMPLALTFDDAYAYTLAGEDTVNGIPCWALDFTPRVAASDKPLYAGTVWVAKADFAAIRTRTRQLNLTAEIQAVDETSGLRRGACARRRAAAAPSDAHDRPVDPQDVLADDGHRAREHAHGRPARPAGVPRRAPGRVRLAGRRWSATRKRASGTSRRRRTAGASSPRTRSAGTSSASAASSTTARSTTRFRSSASTTSTSTSSKRHDQVQVLFGGVLLAASYNQPRLFGTAVDVGVDVFGIAIRGSDALFVDGDGGQDASA